MLPLWPVGNSRSEIRGTKTTLDTRLAASVLDADATQQEQSLARPEEVFFPARSRSLLTMPMIVKMILNVLWLTRVWNGSEPTSFLRSAWVLRRRMFHRPGSSTQWKAQTYGRMDGQTKRERVRERQRERRALLHLSRLLLFCATVFLSRAASYPRCTGPLTLVLP